MAITLHGTDGIDSPDFNATGSVVPANGMYLPSANTLAWTTNSTRNMTLDSSGNLGIGTSSPGFKLSVAGYSNVNSANKLAIGDVADYQARLYMESANETFTIENTSDYASSAIAFRINGSERARIDSSGNLLVGTTSTLGNCKVNVLFSSSTVNGLSIYDVPSSGTANMVLFYRGGAQVGSITSTSSATSYVTSSDQRLKENIVDAPSAINSVNAIKIRSFDWKADGSHVDYGYIAQELLEVAPEAVSVPKDPDEMMGVDFGKLTPRIIKALQELTQRLEALEAK